MKSQAFANFSLTILPTIGLIIFALVFIALCLWTFRRKGKAFYKDMAKIPFDEDRV